ncbi:MAG: phosphatidate cytidylyltransferase [Endomicrobia bacterium]|nr:phosphatidate cytidylyltransferase [Endomicrobiia bacterium]MDW8055258.1 phosphatidate cytidylyltransferase [Elusimicrobiota bacterium]
MLLPRVITALLGIPIILLAVYYGSGLFLVLLFIILLYMLKEFVHMSNTAGYEISWVLVFITGFVVFFSVIFEPLQFNKYALYLTSINITLIFFLFFLIEIIKQKPLGAIGRISVGFGVPFLLSWSMAHLYLLRDIRTYGMKLTYILFLTIWITDNAAYIFGTLFGKRKLASVVSPKKTVVGLIASIIFGLLGFIFLCRIFRVDNILGYNNIIFIGILLPILSTISDLAESLIKRDCGFKDSDNLLIGHGGMMDRFDSFIFTTPVFYYFVQVLLRK